MDSNYSKEELDRIFYTGITDYLNTLGRFYVTPFGVYDTLKEVEQITGCFRTTLLRRFRNNNKPFLNWYYVDGNTPLHPAETCKYTDEVDDLLFSKGYWLIQIEDHQYGTPLEDNTIIVYSLYGEIHKLSYKDFKETFKNTKKEN